MLYILYILLLMIVLNALYFIGLQSQGWISFWFIRKQTETLTRHFAQFHCDDDFRSVFLGHTCRLILMLFKNATNCWLLPHRDSGGKPKGKYQLNDWTVCRFQRNGRVICLAASPKRMTTIIYRKNRNPRSAVVWSWWCGERVGMTLTIHSVWIQI